MNAPIPDNIARAAPEVGNDLEHRVQAILSLEAIVARWDENQILTAQALKTAIEELNKEAFRRLIKSLKDEPAAAAKLRAALADPLVYGVLRFHGLVKEPLEERLRRALDEVRPLMQGHGGDVELVAFVPPHTVEIRLVGSCHGCPSSSQTLTEGVEKAIHAHCPEIHEIRQVSRGASASNSATNGATNGTTGGATAAPAEAKIHFVSPFAINVRSGWQDVAALGEIPDGGILERSVNDHSVLLSRRGERVSCLENRCAHLGMPLDMGQISDGVITCSYHGFQYLLETGECLTAPEVQLKVHAVRLQGDRVHVRVGD